MIRARVEVGVEVRARVGFVRGKKG
jgi:hypothetical protein